MRFFTRILLCSAMAFYAPALLHAQSSTPVTQSSTPDEIQEIVVTAEKREESIDKVPISITAIGGSSLVQQGIETADDLVKVVPGFTYTESERGAPIYGIRGIVFEDSTLGSNSPVALYEDEVPLSSPNEARISSTMDLERVEVLKGPQGTLFGQNSTAGLINFIAAKPTDEFSSGLDGSYSRFDTTDIRGFISGPITDTLKIRVSAMAVNSDGWQESYTRDASLGAKREFAGRAILQWDPSTKLKVTARVDGWVDQSDTQAVQLLQVVPFVPSGVNPIYDFYPRAPSNDRAADWDANPVLPLRRDDHNVQGSIRVAYDLTDSIQLTSISAGTRYDQHYVQDVDGANYPDDTFLNIGSLHRFTQELRAALNLNNLTVLVGANYWKEDTKNYTDYFSGGNSSGPVTGILGTDSTNDQTITNDAVFANTDYTFGDFTVHGGVRYTEDRRDFSGCLADNGDGTGAAFFNEILKLTGTSNAIQPGGCLTVLSSGLPGLVNERLDQDNVSWRTGLDWHATPDEMLYVNVSKGYKSGAFQDTNAAVQSQYAPAKQESVLAYEGGLKAGLFNKAVQFNAAGFYYDYRNKQLFGRLEDPLHTFGVLQFLLNIPKSQAYGAEAQVEAHPISGLRLNAAATYTKTEVLSNFVAIDPVGNTLNYRGLPFPHTPEWSATASADYEHPFSATMKGFIGGNLVYQSATQAFFNDPSQVGETLASPVERPGAYLNPNTFQINAYATVDARLGVAGENDRWRAWIWGRNIFNKYYWTNVTQVLDTVGRYAGMPATFGISGSFRF